MEEDLNYDGDEVPLSLSLVIPSKLDSVKSGDKFWEPVHWTFTFGAVFWK